MESGDQQIPENSGDQQAGTNQGAVPKSYECNFCKRGFSNAQALGGHMNIHRKDKAKLKQVSSSTNIVETKPPQPPQQRVPLEIPKIPAPSYSPILPKTNPTINSLEALNKLHGDHVSTATTERGSSWQANWHLNDKEGLCDISQSNHAVQVQVYHLPLFSQAPSDQDHQNLGQQQVPLEQQQRQQVQGDRREEGSELDLELRLGPEPQDSSSTSAKATTRKFF